MALVIKDRVRQTSTTAGTGTITLSGSVTGYQDFTVIGTGNTTYYTIADQSGSNWEVGLGTYTSPNQLARTTVYESSNGNALVNFGSNIKDVFVTLPAEAVPTGGSGTVTQVNTSGNVSGITLTGGPITTTGTVTLGGSLDLSAPPAIGGTTPNTITGTTVSATMLMTLPTVTSGNVGVGILQMVDGGDGYDYLNIYSDDVGFSYKVKFPYGADIAGSLNITGTYIGQSALFIGDGIGSGSINLRGVTYGYDITVQAPASFSSAYTLTLPTTAGSNNQILKTDGSGNLSWLDLSAPPAIGGTTPAAGTFTNIASATAPTNTVPALALTGTPNAAAGAKTGVLGIGTNFTATDKNIMASFVQDINDYTQIVVQNPNAGTGASADFIVNNDNTTGAGTYGDFGINSSTFSGANSFGLANATYLYSQGGDLSIGTASNNNIRFVVNGNATDVGTITSTGLNSCAIGATTASTGSFTTLSATSVAATSSIARAAGSTSVTSVLNQATFTTGGKTLATQTAAANATWRIRAFGTFTAISNATARTAQVAVFWGSTQLPAITPTVLASTAQTTQWQLEFTVTASSTTAVWTAGQLMNRLNSATALALDTVTAASTTVTAGSQTIDLRFRVSTAVASEGWNVQSVTIERLV